MYIKLSELLKILNNNLNKLKTKRKKMIKREKKYKFTKQKS